MKSGKSQSWLKWVPVVVATVVAFVQAIGEKANEEQMEDMENRISKLEDKEEA